MDGLIERNPAAAGALYDRLGKTVNRHVWRLLGADSEHDDIVHQVFVNALTSIDKLKDPSALDDWIVGIAINTVRKELRNRKYRRFFVCTDAHEQTAQDRGDTERQFMLSRVFEILQSMKIEHYIAFILRFVEGNTIREVALKQGCSLATAKRRVAGAKTEFWKRARRDSFLSSHIEKSGWSERRNVVGA